MSSTNTLDDSQQTTTPGGSQEENNTTPETTQGTDSTEAPETKDEMALAVQNGPDKSLSLKLRTSDLPQHRPITASQHQVAETFGSVGEQRPIFASTLAVSGIIKSSGERPISASTLVVSETYSLMGGKRPIASNAIDDDPNILMGYLD